MFAEIPADRWIGNWECGKDSIVLNEDTTCLIKWGGKTIKGHYGIDWILGNLIVISNKGQAHVFSATLIDDSHRYDSLHPANGLWFGGYAWDVEHPMPNQSHTVLTFRRKK